MNNAHIHLLINHVPVLGTLLVLALLAFAAARRSSGRTRDALGVLAVLGAVSVVVYLTGGAAEDSVENLPGVSERMIESHEEAALAATVALGALAALAIATLWRFRGRVLPRWVAFAGLFGTAVVAGMMAWTANLGGQIRHSEIRADGAAATVEAAVPAADEGHERGEEQAR
ncbi:MAG: hypothetical protein HOQ11_00870 [Gemmatimonadaceae bacterium]|nr:hypothetical protein [Gemmatimonadaceae bacterium]NUQ92885.1 hypothetical protein [Gemmatimonadaceae bacterium]NUR18770.1 hypothetical protein [Gemmatimonadaceae bacterium]NUS95940.1 hypothetical protein [Gemmatimonadaceae bacterium]